MRWPHCLSLVNGGSSGVFPDSTRRHRWSAGSETSAALQQPIPNSTVRADCFYCPIWRLICINKASVSVSSCRFCSWPRCCNHSILSFFMWRSSKNKNKPLLSLDWFFYWQSVFGMRQLHTGYNRDEFDVDTRNENYKPRAQCSPLFRLNIQH